MVDSIGPFLYEDNDLKVIFTSAGRIVKIVDGSNVLWKYEYNLTDHLGNVRAVFAAHNNGIAELMQQTDYYPFGLVMNQQEKVHLEEVKNRYLYNGKELQDDNFGVSLDWYKYADDDGNEHYKYQDGDDGSIDVDGNTYENVGSSVSIQLGGDSYINAFQNLTMQSFGEAVDLKSKILNDRGLFLDYIKNGSDLSMQGRVELFGSHVSKTMGEDGTKVMMGIGAVTGGVIGAGELVAALPLLGDAAMNQLALMEYNSAFVSSNLALPYNASIATGTLLNHTQVGQWIMAGILAQAPFGLQSGFNIPQQKKVIMEWLQKSFQLRKANKKNK